MLLSSGVSSWSCFQFDLIFLLFSSLDVTLLFVLIQIMCACSWVNNPFWAPFFCLLAGAFDKKKIRYCTWMAVICFYEMIAVRGIRVNSQRRAIQNYSHTEQGSCKESECDSSQYSKTLVSSLFGNVIPPFLV